MSYIASKETMIDASDTLDMLMSGEPVSNRKTRQALHLAARALHKQIPVKPRPYTDAQGIARNGCPSCERDEILYIGQQYCHVCGQRIDWSEII